MCNVKYDDLRHERSTRACRGDHRLTFPWGTDYILTSKGKGDHACDLNQGGEAEADVTSLCSGTSDLEHRTAFKQACNT